MKRFQKQICKVVNDKFKKKFKKWLENGLSGAGWEEMGGRLDPSITYFPTTIQQTLFFYHFFMNFFYKHTKQEFVIHSHRNSPVFTIFTR